MNRMFQWTGLMETGTWTARTSSSAAKLMPTHLSPCISGKCECNSVIYCQSANLQTQISKCTNHFLFCTVQTCKLHLRVTNDDVKCFSVSHVNDIFYAFCRINGSIPSNADIRDNVLTFKGPVTYDMHGIYVCDATNSIGTRSGSVEVSIIGTFFPSTVPICTFAACLWEVRLLSFYWCVCVFSV